MDMHDIPMYLDVIPRFVILRDVVTQAANYKINLKNGIIERDMGRERRLCETAEKIRDSFTQEQRDFIRANLKELMEITDGEPYKRKERRGRPRKVTE